MTEYINHPNTRRPGSTNYFKVVGGEGSGAGQVFFWTSVEEGTQALVAAARAAAAAGGRVAAWKRWALAPSVPCVGEWSGGEEE